MWIGEEVQGRVEGFSGLSRPGWRRGVLHGYLSFFRERYTDNTHVYNVQPGEIADSATLTAHLMSIFVPIEEGVPEDVVWIRVYTAWGQECERLGIQEEAAKYYKKASSQAVDVLISAWQPPIESSKEVGSFE